MKLSIQITLLFSIITGSQVFAHTSLKSSIPSDKSQINQQPKSLVLEYNKPVQLLKVTILNQQEVDIPLNYQMLPNSNLRFEIPLNNLKHGKYIVKWIALGGDSHRMKGSISFSYEGEPPSGQKNTTKNSKNRQTNPQR